MTTVDLQNYHSVWREPVRGNYRGYGVISMAPPSSGGVALMQLLKMVEPFPLREYGFQSGEAVHLMVEAERRVYADRARYLGDPDFYPVPVEGLLKESYLTTRMETFEENHATSSDLVEAGLVQMTESEQTTHYSIVDSMGECRFRDDYHQWRLWFLCGGGRRRFFAE